MIKLKSILKENQILITEKFAAGKLRALTNHWQGLEAQFFMWGAKLGVEWDKIKDSEIETNTKPNLKTTQHNYIRLWRLWRNSLGSNTAKDPTDTRFQ